MVKWVVASGKSLTVNHVNVWEYILTATQLTMPVVSFFVTLVTMSDCENEIDSAFMKAIEELSAEQEVTVEYYLAEFF